MGITKTITIVNLPWCYVLKVEGKSIQFQGMASVEFFKKHFTDLGYVVIELDETI